MPEDKLVYTLAEYQDRSKLTEEEILFKVLHGELHSTFFAPAIWLIYRGRLGSVNVGNERINIWKDEVNKIFSGFPILPRDQVKRILHWGGYRVRYVYVGKNLLVGRGIFGSFEEWLEITGEAFIDIQPLTLKNNNKLMRVFLKDDFYLESYSDLVYRSNCPIRREDIQEIRGSFDFHDSFMMSKNFSFNNLERISSKLKIENSIIGEIKTFIETAIQQEEEKWRFSNIDSITYEDIFSLLPLEMVKGVLRLSKDLSDHIRDDSLNFIEDKIENSNSILAITGGFFIDHNESSRDFPEEYKNFFREFFDEDLEDDEWSMIDDNEIFKKYDIYISPNIFKKDILIFNPDVDPYKLTSSTDNIAGEPDEVEIGIVSHLERFTLTQLANEPTRKFSVKEIADKAQQVYGAQLEHMGGERLRNIIGASIPEERKRGMKSKKK